MPYATVGVRRTRNSVKSPSERWNQYFFSDCCITRTTGHADREGQFVVYVNLDQFFISEIMQGLKQVWSIEGRSEKGV